MTIRDTIRDVVFGVVKDDGIKKKDIVVEIPAGYEHGDYAVPVMRWAKVLKKDPYTIATDIREKLLDSKRVSANFDEIEIVKPGYINFFVSNAIRIDHISTILGKHSPQFTQAGKGKKINVEFISVNPTGELHIGHARSAFYGDVLCNILSISGYNITREYYVNNARHSAQIQSLGKTVKGKCTEYSSDYLDDKISRYHEELAGLDSDGDAGHFMSTVIQEDIQKFLEQKADIHFDVWKQEQDFYNTAPDAIQKTLELLKSAGLVYESEGATWLATSKLGAEKDDVLVRSNGDNTYFLVDIVYHLDKVERGFNRLINVWGADHYGHIQRLSSAVDAASKRIDDTRTIDLNIITTQLVRLTGGEKLSKRKGTIITMSEMLDVIGLDAARYFYLGKSLNTQMEIDLDVASQKSNNNPLYYIQYTNARICSIMNKARELGVEPDNASLIGETLSDEAEVRLAGALVKVVDVVEDAARDYQVHSLPSFTFELSKQFNQFYRDMRVIDDKNVDTKRLALARATSIVICSVLDIMGISHPESM